jgi:thymidylate synthase
VGDDVALTAAAATADDLFHQVVSKLLAQAKPVTPPPTKGACSEVTGALLELSNPAARVSLSVTRGRLFSALGELGWYLSGSGRTEHIAYYLTDYWIFDESGRVHGGYGPRLRAYDGVDQLSLVADLLQRKPSSRRAVIQLYDHTDLVGEHRDVPCTCSLQFLLREGELRLVVYMRSNDAYRGLPHDLFCFTMLQEIMARRLGAILGTYTHVVGSLHLYDENRDAAQRFIGEGYQSTLVQMPPMPEGDPFPALERLLANERALRTGTPWQEVDVIDDPYWGDIGLMYAGFQRRRGPRAELEQLHAALHHTFYKPFMQQLIDKCPEA